MKLALIVAALAGAVSLPVAAQPVGAPEMVTIRLSDFKFDPAQIRLHAGKTYVLHLVNAAADTHEFTAKDFLKAAQISPETRSVAHHGEVELKGGQAAELKLVAPAAGQYDPHCGKPGHARMGMTGTIVVE